MILGPDPSQIQTAASPATLAVLGNQDLLKINQDPLNEQARMLVDGKDLSFEEARYEDWLKR